MVEPLRAAVVGAGHVGRMHVRVVGESDAAELAAVVDPDVDAHRVAHTGRAAWYPSVEALLESDRPDFAIVAVPTAGHAAVAQTLVEAGVPVLVEKPLCESEADAAQLIAACRRADVTLGVGHVERFNPAVRALQEKLSQGILGRIFQVHARRLSPFPIRVGDSGVAMDLATHDLDLMCELAGRPVRVAAETGRKAHRTHEDLLAAILRFDTGIIGLLEVNWLTPAKVRRLTVTGEGGMLVVDYVNQHLTLYENAQATEAWETIAIFEGVTEGNVTRFAIPRVEPLRAQLESFVRAVRREEPVSVPGEQGLRAVRLARALVAAGTGEPVVDLDASASTLSRVT